ncbi:hypothetical protein Tco_1503807 [Tanacetum coccineum]
MDFTKAEQMALDDASLVAPDTKTKDCTSETMLQYMPKIRNQRFDEPPFEQEILTFLVSLGHSGEIRKITDVNVNKLHQPWRSFAAVINKCLSGKSSYDSLRLSQAQIIWGMEVPPKTKASVHKKKVDSDTTPKEKPPTDPKGKRVKQTGKMTDSGNPKQPATGDRVDIVSKVLDEQVHEKTGTDEGAGDKPEVPDVTNIHSHKSDDDGDNITHPKLSTFSTDDQEEQDDEEEQEEDEEEIFDQLVRTPSLYQTTDESKKQKDDDRVKDGEEDKERGRANVIWKEQSSSVSDLVLKFISLTTDEGIDYILTPHTESTTLINVPISVATVTPATTTTILPPLFPTSYGIASSLSELELKRILVDKMEENKSIDRSYVQKNLYNALVEAYNTDKDLLSSYGDVLIIPRTRGDKDKDEEPSAGSNRGTKRQKT